MVENIHQVVTGLVVIHRVLTLGVKFCNGSQKGFCVEFKMCNYLSINGERGFVEESGIKEIISFP